MKQSDKAKSRFLLSNTRQQRNTKQNVFVFWLLQEDAVLFPLYHHTCGLAQPLLFPALQHGVSQHLFQLLPQFEEAPAPSPFSSSGQSGQDIHHILKHCLKPGAH